MNLFLLGISHKTASVEVREAVAFSNEETAQILPELQEKFLKEAVLVSTCNRTELYGVPHDDSFKSEDLVNFLIEWKRANFLKPQHFYIESSFKAAEHLMEVTSGIDSLIVGDVQILQQVRDAYELSGEKRTAGTLMHELFHTSFRVGKRAKAETAIGKGAVSISYAAVELSEKIFADLKTKKAILIGAGETAELTAKHLRNHGIGHLLIANRTLERAQNLASQYGAMAIPLSEINQFLKNVDIVISSVHSQDYILKREDVKAAMKTRPSAPLVIVDIGMPRNIDPKAGEIDNVFLEDIDSLEMIANANHERRKSELPKVREIIAQELQKFKEWAAVLDVVPTIKSLRDKCEDIRQSGLQKYKYKFAPEDFEKVDELTKVLVNRILASPISALREYSQNSADHPADTEQILHAVQQLFALPPRSEAEEDKVKK
ncbi:MAG TPA: glutamyl-tRNA reductase [Patescibacteria group bacterium]|nr:glutamyl-tRNA reductase [Patescibacteria group bacterium]